MTYVATDPPSHKGATNTWLTPKYFFDELGPFDLDPCAAPEPRPFPTATTMITEQGLGHEWTGRVWLNPPYGDFASLWIHKLEAHGNGIALLFSRTDTSWLQPIMKRNGVYFLSGRISFLKHDGTKAGDAGSPSILIPFGNYNLGKILTSNLKGVWKQ